MTDFVNLPGGRHQIIDLSVTISNETAAFEPMPHKIDYVDHREGRVSQSALLDDGLEWPGELAAAVEVVTLPSHGGTHIDAPYHYGPESGGAPAETIDEVALSTFFGDAFVLDMSHKKAGDSITADDVEQELERIGYEVKDGDIALVRTDASDQFESVGYQNKHAGLRRSATEWLVRRGVRLIGIDAWGLDRPFDAMSKDLKAGDEAQFWESHIFGREMPYCQIEKLVNLRDLPVAHGFSVAAFPIKLHRASAAWARVVAFVPDTR